MPHEIEPKANLRMQDFIGVKKQPTVEPFSRYMTELRGSDPDRGVNIWRNWLTDDRMKRLDLNERQIKAVQFLKSDLHITNAGYQKLNGVLRATAKRDLDELVKLGILKLEGAGRSARYRLTGNRLKNGSNGSF